MKVTHKHKNIETWYIAAITGAFLDQKRVNVCEHTLMMVPHETFHSDVAPSLSHTFTLFWLRKASVIAEIHQVSTCLCVIFIWRSLHFSVRVFPFISYLLCCLYFSTFLSTWSLHDIYNSSNNYSSNSSSTAHLFSQVFIEDWKYETNFCITFSKHV